MEFNILAYALGVVIGFGLIALTIMIYNAGRYKGYSEGIEKQINR